MNVGTLIGAVRANIGIRSGSLLRIMLGALFASGLLSLLAQAQAAPPPFTGFIDPNKVVIANSPSKVAYLGAGTGETSWVTRYTDNSWVGSEFGFDAEKTDLDTFRSTIPYASAPAFKKLLARGKIVDMVTGFVGEYNANDPALGRDVIAVVVLELTTPNGSIAYEVHVLGPMDESFSGSIKVTGTGTGGTKPKIVLAGQTGPLGQRTANVLVVTKSDDGQLGLNKIDSYRVSFITNPALPSLVPNIPSVTPVESYRTEAGQYILDIAHRPSHEGLFKSASSPTRPGQSSGADQIFLTAEALKKPAGTDRKYRPVIYAHVLTATGNFASHTRLNTQAVIGQTGIGPDTLQVSEDQIRASDAFDLLYDAFVTNDSGKPGYFMALRSNDRVALAYYDPGLGLVQAWRWSSGTITQCEEPNGGIDFRAYQTSGSSFNANKVEWRLVCVKPNTDLGFGTNARLGVEATSGTGINLGNLNMVSRVFGHIGQGGITRSNYGYSDPQVFLEFPCLEILQAVDVYRPTVAEGDGDAVEFRGDECSATAAEVTKGNKDDGIVVGSPGNVSFTVLAAQSIFGSKDRRLADALALLHATYAVAEKTTEVVQTKVAIGTDGKKKKKDEEVEVTAFAGAPYIGNPWPVLEVPASGLGGNVTGAMRTLARLPSNGQVLTINLDAKFDNCRKGANFSIGNGLGQCNPVTVETKPIPIAALFAPPFVANSGQEPNTYASTYGRTRDATSANDKTTGSTANFSVGLDWRTSIAEGSFSGGYETAIGQSQGSSQSTSLTVGFLPAASNENLIVISTTSNYLFTGQVIYSSDGFGFPVNERSFELYVPYDVLTDLRNWSELQTDPLTAPYFAKDSPRSLYPGFEKLFSHVPGDPGSYPEYKNDGGRSLFTTNGNDGRCLGLPFPGFDPSNRVVRRRNSPALNAFIKSNLPSTKEDDIIADAVLVSEGSLVPARVPSSSGFSNQTFAEIALGVTAERSYHEEHTVSFDFEFGWGPEFEGNGARFTAGFGSGISEGIEQSYSTGQGSQFQSAISNLPFRSGLFPAEENYVWRLYLCTSDIGSAAGLPALPISVLGFTVNNYHGLGNSRFEALGPIAPVYPRGLETVPQVVPRNPLLVFDQPEGTVMRYDVMLTEGSSGAPSRRANIVYCDANPETGPVKACDTSTRPDRVTMGIASRANPLARNTTYSWRVKATDHTGTTKLSPIQYFRTEDTADVPLEPSLGARPTDLVFTKVETFNVAAPIVLQVKLTEKLLRTPPAAIAGQTVVIASVQDLNQPATTNVVCRAVTNAKGIATCTVAPSDVRTSLLIRLAGGMKASFAGVPGQFNPTEEIRPR